MGSIYRARHALLVVLIFLLCAYLTSRKFESDPQPNMFRQLVSSSVLLLASGLPVVSAVQNSSDIRLNHIQVIGTHNSYHREINITTERTVFEEYLTAAGESPEDYYYSHAELPNQLDYQSVRSLEIDLHSDEKGGLYYPPWIWTKSNLTNGTTPYDGSVLLKPGIKVFHVTDFDTDAVCHTFVDCLTILKTWSDANRNHVPILIDLELKTDAAACSLGGVCAEEAQNWTLPRLLNVDAEIRSVLPDNYLITPDLVRQGNLTLEETVLTVGWPKLNDVRGRFMFYFDNDPSNSTTSPRALYTSGGHSSLQNRTVFTNAEEGDPDCAFIKHNTPTGDDLADIQRQVGKGYIVRTRADEPIQSILNKETQRRADAFNSGAQIVTTDWPVYGMSARYAWDYAVQLPGAKIARCNPVTAPKGCNDEVVAAE